MTLPAGTPTELFVDGKWVAGSDGTLPVLDPSTGEVITEVARAGADDVARAVEAAAGAQPGWAATAPRERGEVLRKAFELMISRREEIAYVMSLEMGKSLTDSRAEVTYAAEFFRWFSEEAVRIGGELRTAPSGANRILTFRKPVGVSLLLTPWNFPAAMATRKIGPALAAGCTVILKPAHETPLTALLLAQVLTDAGAPPGIVVVLDDADLDAAVSGAMLAKMRNGGQACTAANRFLVQESVAAEFAERLGAAMGALRVGAGTDEQTQLGPMVSERAV